MTALGEWLKQLVLIVLLAAITDLLLPSQAMQKYVRTVLGLAIVAAMLQPIVPFFQHNWAEQLASYASNEVLSSGDGSASPNLTQLTNELSRQQQADSSQFLANELASQIDSRFACTGVVVTIGGADIGSSVVSVRVSLRQEDSSKRSAIADWIATTLQVDPQRVIVTARGGGVSGGS